MACCLTTFASLFLRVAILLGIIVAMAVPCKEDDGQHSQREVENEKNRGVRQSVVDFLSSES